MTNKELRDNLLQQIISQRNIPNDGYYNLYDPETGHQETMRWDGRLQVTNEIMDHIVKTFLNIRRIEGISCGGTGEPV